MSRPQPLDSHRKAGASRKTVAAAVPSVPHATIAFRGTTATIRLAPATSVAAIRYDGATLAEGDWRLAADGDLTVACPAAAFDAAPHHLHIAWQQPGLAPLELPFRSHYQGELDRVGDTEITGWLIDRLRPDSPLALDVACGRHTARVHNAMLPPATQAGDATVRNGAFAVTLPPRPADSAPELVVVTVEGTTCQPFGPILRGTTLPAAVATAAAAARGLGRTAGARLFGTMLLPALLQAWTDAAPPSAVRLAGTQFLPRPTPPEIDVIVPVYRGRQETLACLDSLLQGGNRVRHRIVVVDDCSPDADLSAALRELADAGRIHLLRNDSNLGFVASANRGMALSAGADVLLLNADTVAPAGFLDRLWRAAYSDAAIATVTPLSNNATAYSLPAPPGDAADPWGLPCQDVDDLCRTANAGVVRDIPTAHGFCMFVRRAALDDVGMFDAATFGTGYGEENDFSLRALLRGWRNVCAADVYVRHTALVSFTAAAARDAQLAANLRTVHARYPFYAAFVADFLRTDPLHDLRNNVQKALWRQHQRICVFVTLALDGGAARHSADAMARLAGEGWLTLALAAEPDADGSLRLTLRRAGSEEALRYPATAAVEAVLADILDLAPRFLHVQHVIDLPDGVAEFVRDCGIPYAVTLHDFFYACPRVTLLDAGVRYCGMPPAAKCTLCVRQGPIHPQIHASLAPYAEDGEAWRAKWESLLRGAAQLIAPSRDTAARYAHLFPGLAATVRPHFTLHQAPSPPPAAAMPRRTLRVALPGAIGPQKGVLALAELARHCSRWDDDIEFVIVGYTDREEELKRFGNVSVRGGYRPEDAVAALAAADCRVALLLNVFPETFSYTLSESLAAGLTPVACDFGAIGERMRALRAGVLVPPGAPPEHLVAAIRKAAQMRTSVPLQALYGQYEQLLADYYDPALADLIDTATPPDLPCILGPVRGQHPDGWCDATISLFLWSRRPLQRIALDLWIPPEGRFQAVEITCNHDALARRPLVDDGVQRIVCTLPEHDGRLLEIGCSFDFQFRLQAPDVRSCAAMLSAMRVNDGAGWLTVELPHAARVACA